jgi:hypothetical protein
LGFSLVLGWEEQRLLGEVEVEEQRLLVVEEEQQVQF